MGKLFGNWRWRKKDLSKKDGKEGLRRESPKITRRKLSDSENRILRFFNSFIMKVPIERRSRMISLLNAIVLEGKREQHEGRILSITGNVKLDKTLTKYSEENYKRAKDLRNAERSLEKQKRQFLSLQRDQKILLDRGNQLDKIRIKRNEGLIDKFEIEIGSLETQIKNYNSTNNRSEELLLEDLRLFFY